MRTRGLFSFLPLLILSVYFVDPISLQAQFVCSGKACEFIPGGISRNLDAGLFQIEQDYLQHVLKNNLRASFLSNALSNSVGQGHVRRIQIGVGMAGSGVKRDDIRITNPYIDIPALPNGGVALQPSIHLDFNLGWVFGFPENSFLHRFSVFFHGVDARMSQSDLKSLGQAQKNITLAGRMDGYGGTIRFQIARPVGFAGYLFSWNGINLGAGYHRSRQSYNAIYGMEKPMEIKIQGVEGRWAGDTEFGYRIQSQTYNLDVRTGVGLFWVLHAFVGGGYTWNSGDSNITLRRSGPYVIKTGLITSLEIPAEYQQLFASEIAKLGGEEFSGTLGLRSSARGRLRTGMGYAVGGLDLDLIFLKITLEAAYAGKEQMGGSLAARLAF